MNTDNINKAIGNSRRIYIYDGAVYYCTKPDYHHRVHDPYPHKLGIINPDGSLTVTIDHYGLGLRQVRKFYTRLGFVM